MQFGCTITAIIFRLLFTLQILGDEATGNYSHHSIFTVETELTDDLDLDVSLVWDRTRQPVAEENGDIPEQDDFRFLIGLGYDL